MTDSESKAYCSELEAAFAAERGQAHVSFSKIWCWEDGGLGCWERTPQPGESGLKAELLARVSRCKEVGRWEWDVQLWPKRREDFRLESNRKVLVNGEATTAHEGMKVVERAIQKLFADGLEF